MYFSSPQFLIENVYLITVFLIIMSFISCSLCGLTGKLLARVLLKPENRSTFSNFINCVSMVLAIILICLLMYLFLFSNRITYDGNEVAAYGNKTDFILEDKPGIYFSLPPKIYVSLKPVRVCATNETKDYFGIISQKESGCENLKINPKKLFSSISIANLQNGNLYGEKNTELIIRYYHSLSLDNKQPLPDFIEVVK